MPGSLVPFLGSGLSNHRLGKLGPTWRPSETFRAVQDAKQGAQMHKYVSRKKSRVYVKHIY